MGPLVSSACPRRQTKYFGLDFSAAVSSRGARWWKVEALRSSSRGFSPRALLVNWQWKLCNCFSLPHGLYTAFLQDFHRHSVFNRRMYEMKVSPLGSIEIGVRTNDCRHPFFPSFHSPSVLVRRECKVQFQSPPSM